MVPVKLAVSNVDPSTAIGLSCSAVMIPGEALPTVSGSVEQPDTAALLLLSPE